MAKLFSSERLVYRGIEGSPEDEAFIHSLYEDTAARELFDTNILKPMTKKESAKFTAFMAENNLLSVLICLPPPPPNDNNDTNEAAKPIGVISLIQPGPKVLHHRNSDIVGVAIDKHHRRKGYATEAIRWTLNWAFAHAGLHRVGIGCVSYNEGARKAYERLGFTVEGRKREAVWHDGAWHDVILFAMLEGEWAKLKLVGDSEEKKGSFMAVDGNTLNKQMMLL